MNQIVLMETELRELYINQKMQMRDIAAYKGVAIGTVFNYCKKYGIAARTHKENFKIFGKPMSEENRRIISKAHKGKVMSDEQKKKLSESKKVGGIGFKKLRGDGYTYVYFPDHPNSTAEGYIMEHILIMECLIGRHLYDNEVVHHINKKRSDNRKENLQLMTASEHMSMHMTERHAENRGRLL